MNTLIPSLIDLCARHTLPAHIPAVLPEPYFPHLPAPWNGVLVLGEAQHLGRKNDAYACHMVECVNASGSPADSLPKAS